MKRSIVCLIKVWEIKTKAVKMEHELNSLFFGLFLPLEIHAAPEPVRAEVFITISFPDLFSQSKGEATIGKTSVSAG